MDSRRSCILERGPPPAWYDTTAVEDFCYALLAALLAELALPAGVLVTPLVTVYDDGEALRRCWLSLPDIRLGIVLLHNSDTVRRQVTKGGNGAGHRSRVSAAFTSSMSNASGSNSPPIRSRYSSCSSCSGSRRASRES